MKVSQLFLSNRLRAWRDDELYAAAQVFRQVAADLIAEADAAISTLPRRDLVTRQGAFLTETVEPMVRAVTEPVIANLLDSSNRRLRDLAESVAVWAAGPTDGAHEQPLDGWQDVALAAGPLTGGIAAAASIPAIAITTTSSFFGLLTTTAISWPVVVGGSALAAGLITTGAWNAGQLTDRLRRRLHRKTKDQILATLIAGRKSKSLLEQYAEVLDEAVKHASNR